MIKTNTLNKMETENMGKHRSNQQLKNCTPLGRVKRLIMCRIFKRHKYFVLKEFSKTVRKVGCERCGLAWGMNDRVRAFLPWDEELEELHKDT